MFDVKSIGSAEKCTRMYSVLATEIALHHASIKIPTRPPSLLLALFDRFQEAIGQEQKQPAVSDSPIRFHQPFDRAATQVERLRAGRALQFSAQSSQLVPPVVVDLPSKCELRQFNF